MGLGLDSCSRSVCGNAFSVYEPRFEFSIPQDFSRNNPRDVLLKFDTYCFSSFISEADCLVEISEDAGASYATAFDGSTFLSPYDGGESKVRRPDSQRLRFYIQKTDLWPVRARILIRVTAVDDFGQEATHVLPVKWD